MYEIGLKLWSTNTGIYIEEAQRLYSEHVFDYVELYVVPDSLDTLPKWGALEMPFTIHSPHYGHGFNPAFPENMQQNFKLYQQSKCFADRLGADYIIFHGGNRGSIKSTASQIGSFNEPRAVIENLPFRTLKDNMRCFGATTDEIKYIMDTAGCMFCFDIGHAVCSANSQGLEPYSYIKSFIDLDPVMFHISGIKDISSCVDSHISLSDGQLDPSQIERILSPASKVTIETKKKYEDSLSDFREDVVWMRSL